METKYLILIALCGAIYTAYLVRTIYKSIIDIAKTKP